MVLAASDLKTAENAAAKGARVAERAADYFQENIPALLRFGIRIVLAFLFFLAGRVVIRWIQKLVKRSLSRSNADQGVVQFVDSFLKFILYTMLLFTIGTKLGVEASSVAALIASGGVAIGLALQGSLSNFAGGVLILLLKPFVVGDYIIEDTGKNEGTVKEIQVFYTKLSTVDNKTIVIPNGTLANSSLTNVTARPVRQLDLKVGVAYDADLKKAKRLIEELLIRDRAIMEDEDRKIFVDSLADSAVILGLRAWVKTEEYWETRWRLLEDIKLTFDKENIEIPYHHLTVHMVDSQKDSSYRS